MIAQTWSEHCKHKILNAEVLYRRRKRNGYPRPSKSTSGERPRRRAGRKTTSVPSSTTTRG
jgi:phosphoribosylformylglycinamidine (FGAM) synthase-like enzyme